MHEEARIDQALETARQLLKRSQTLDAELSGADVRSNRRMGLLIADADAKELTFQLTDEITRPADAARAARRMHRLVTKRNTASLAWLDRAMLRVGARVAPVLPKLVMPMVERRLVNESSRMIVDVNGPALSRHLAQTEHQGLRSNINMLGESIVGDEEAEQRLEHLLELLGRADVNYISVKASAICAGLHPLAFAANVVRVSTALARLFTEAARHSPAKFVNVDMEEFRDVELTVAAFCETLGREEFHQLSAGIVLQAYLPEAVELANHLARWSLDRVARGGAVTKARVVKGANLAMEIVEGEIHGWPVAPYETKGEVDANYKRVLDILLAPEFDGALRVGLASHNVFDVAWGIGLRNELATRGQQARLEFEMLAGMAASQAHALNEVVPGVLLYTPVVARADFSSAVAYLMRRLDENTASENFLSHILEIQPTGAVFDDQADRFANAVRNSAIESVPSARTIVRGSDVVPNELDELFVNEPDTDFSSAANRAWIARHIDEYTPTLMPPPPTVDDVEMIMATAMAAATKWAAMPVASRSKIVNQIADTATRQRGVTIAIMAYEAAKTIGDGDTEVSEAVDFARYYARCALETCDGRPTYVERLDGGVVVVAAPWNFPYAIPFGGVVASLSAGHSVVLKPAPQARQVAKLIVDHCRAAGVPDGVVQLAPCDDDDAGQRLITHPDVAAVILTGSHATAEMFLTWRPELRLHAETSGKNSMIITGGADVDLALKDLVRSAFGHAGQKCSAASLAILTKDLLADNAFLRRLSDATRSLVTGIATNFSTDVAALVGEPSPDLVRALTQLDDGEEWLVQPAFLDAESNLWSPGIRIGVKPDSWFAATECFGPVLGVIIATDLDEAIRIQNVSEFGLTAGLHSLDPDEIDQWVTTAEAGNLYVNRTTTGAIVQRQPFGGWKRSVVGPTAKAGGPFYVASLSQWAVAPANWPADRTVDAEFQAWVEMYMRCGVDRAQLRAESNVYRHVALPGGVALRIDGGKNADQLRVATMASAATGTRLVVSDINLESVAQFALRLPLLGVDRLRTIGEPEAAVRRCAHGLGIAIDDQSIVPWAPAELWRWTREQSISRTMHRHGHMPPSCN